MYNRDILNYIDINKYVIISSVKNKKSVLKDLEKFNVKENVNFFDFKNDLNAPSFTGYLENNFNCDFLIDKSIQSGENNYYSLSLMDSNLEKSIKYLYPLLDEMNFFDFGCGKGKMFPFLSLFEKVNLIGGIEYSSDIFEILKDNLEKINILNKKIEIFKGDASEFKNINNYNVFYFFNPFVGEVFKKVIKNIENSYKGKNRDIYLIYTIPSMYNYLKNHSKFKIIKKFREPENDKLIE